MFKTVKKLVDNKIENEILALHRQKKELEVERDYLTNTLANERAKREMDLAAAEHKSRLELIGAEAGFKRKQSVWEEDKVRLQKALEEDKERQSTILKEDFDRKLNEAISLLKLESEQRIKQAELDCQRRLQHLKEEASKEKMAFQTKLMEEHYKKLNDALVDLHSKGTTTTQFVQELALKMLDKPVGATITENRLLIDTKGTTNG